jgi:ribosomal protein S18 acetylase RimI-like enzyme
MPTRSKKADTPPDPRKLVRETAGRYVTGDARFAVEKGSGGWMVVDAEQTNEFGLPLVRGPFDTLDEAKAAVEAVREEPAPTSALAARIAEQTKSATEPGRSSRPAARRKADRPPKPPPPPPIVVREYRSRDAGALRALWEEVEFHSVGDDDASLRRFAARNPGLLLVAAEGERIVASALGAWDGRRGWIYHVATAPSHRRQGLATRLVRQIEATLRELGCPRANVLVRLDNADGARFWEALGYADRSTRQFGRDLDPAGLLPGRRP